MTHRSEICAKNEQASHGLRGSVGFKNAYSRHFLAGDFEP